MNRFLQFEICPSFSTMVHSQGPSFKNHVPMRKILLQYIFFLPHLRNSYSSHPNDFEDNRIIDNQNGAKSDEYWGEGGIESYLNCSSFWNGAETYLDWNNPFCLETKDGCCSSSSADFSQSSCSRQFFIVWFGFKMEWREGFFGI